jgi:signal transduction histidine kinase
MRTPRTKHRWAVGIGLGVIVAAVLASTLLQERVARRIDSSAFLLSRDVGPAVALLGELRLLTSYLIERTRAETEGTAWSLALSDRARAITLQHPPPTSIEDAMGRLRALVGEGPFLVARDDPQQLGKMLPEQVRQLEDAIGRARDALHKGDRAAATRILETDAQSLALTIHLAATSLLEHEATAAESAAQGIEQSRRQLRHLQRTLAGLVALLAAGAGLLAFFTLREITRAHELRARDIEARADELEAFAGRVAHDVLGPLTAVGSALFIARKLAPTPLVKDASIRGESSLKRVKQIVDGLLSFARAGARGDPEAVSEVRPVVTGLVDELGPAVAEANAELAVADLPDCAVRCSDGVLVSLLSNLLRNSFKYLGDSQTREVTLRVYAASDSVLFEVADTGPGISEELREHVFEPYVRGPQARHKPGIGLGLATVRRLAEAHGGRADYRPRARGGSIFSFELPRAQLSAEQVVPVRAFEGEDAAG